jgi:PKD domain
MGGRLPPRLRHALLTLVVAVLALASFTSLPGALGASPNYVISGVVLQPNGFGVPNGVTVQLTSSATHAVYTTTTSSGGFFQFNSTNTGGALAIGWWGLAVQPQADIHSSTCGGPFRECAILPESSAPQYYWESATNLTTTVTRTISDVSFVTYNATVNATVTFNGVGVNGGTVELISPDYPSFALSENTTNATGVTTFPAPSGSWLLYAEAPGSPSHFSYTPETIPSSGVDHLSLDINNYLAYGSISSSLGGLESAGFNTTLIDTTSGADQYDTYSQYSSTGYSYAVGTYPLGFTGTGAETFDLVISPIGYAPAFLPLSVSSTTPSGFASSNPHNVVVVPMAPPAVYNTTLNYTSGATGSAFGLLNVTTTAMLGNYSVFPDLANASVGQLWAQLALDFAHSTSLTNASFASDVVPWIQAQGPFFPAGQDSAVINGTGFGQPTNYTTQHPNPGITGGYAASYTLSSTQGLSMSWNQVYNTTTGLPKGGTGGQYTFAFNFRHPTNSQSINYTVILPKGYVLKAGTAAPPASKLVPGGPGGTWTKFYLDSKPSSSAYTMANFTAVKYSSVSARVNVSDPKAFTFSTKNVLNESRTNYTAVVGLGENITFSAINSTYPAGTNGSLFVWHFGDGGTNTTTQSSTNHIYTSTGKFDAMLNVTSSGGLTNQISFTIYVGNLPPTAHIEGNWTGAENQSAGGHQYIILNWSQSLTFNLTGSMSTLYAGAPVDGVISDAVWNLTSHNFTKILGNFSAGAGANTSTPVSYSFQGAGNFLTTGMVDGNPVSFKGWQYNLTLTVWDGQGHSANTTLVILVRDTEKPIAVVLAYNGAGKLLSSAGTIEGTNNFASVRLTGKNSTAPHNGTIASYSWAVNNTGNKSFKETNQNESWTYPFPPQLKPYTVNLTVTDTAGNTAYTDYALTVAYNTTTRPILNLANETETTGLTSMTAGTSYTWWFNITNEGGKQSTAKNVQLLVSLTGTSAKAPGGSTAGTPGSVKWYNVSANGTVATSPLAPGSTINLVYNQTIRAEVTLTPSVTGTKYLWGNATCNNCYTYVKSVNYVQVTISQNETQLILEYVAIAAGAIIIIIALILLYRRRGKPASTPSKGGGGGRLERGSSKDEDEDDET